jgi:hypothetical protein
MLHHAMDGSHAVVRFRLHAGEAARHSIRWPRLRIQGILWPRWAAAILLLQWAPIRRKARRRAKSGLGDPQRLINMIELLRGRGWSREQAIICSVAVDLRISNVVDLPNVTVSAFLPEDIFRVRTSAALTSPGGKPGQGKCGIISATKPYGTHGLGMAGAHPLEGTDIIGPVATYSSIYTRTESGCRRHAEPAPCPLLMPREQPGGAALPPYGHAWTGTYWGPRGLVYPRAA